MHRTNAPSTRRPRLATALLLAALAALPAVAPAQDQQPERVVTHFLDHQKPGFVLLEEERALLQAAVDTLIGASTSPARRRGALQALNGLEDGDARRAAEVMLDWQDEGALSAPGMARQVAVVVGLGDIDRVHAAFRRAMNEDSGNPDNWFLLGHALIRAGKDDLAVLAFNQVQTLADLAGDTVSGARAGARLGAIQLRQGNLREAEAQLSDAARTLADSPHADEAAAAYDALAEVYARRAADMLDASAHIYQARDDFAGANAARRRHDAISDLFGPPAR